MSTPSDTPRSVAPYIGLNAYDDDSTVRTAALTSPLAKEGQLKEFAHDLVNGEFDGLPAWDGDDTFDDYLTDHNSGLIRQIVTSLETAGRTVTRNADEDDGGPAAYTLEAGLTAPGCGTPVALSTYLDTGTEFTTNPSATGREQALAIRDFFLTQWANLEAIASSYDLPVR